MGKTVAEPKRKFGERILQLFEESDLPSLAEAARQARLPPRTFRNWLGRDTAPRGDIERVHRLEQVLGGTILRDSQRGEEMFHESRMPFGEKPRRIAQPLDFKKQALDAAGRARHYLAILLERVNDDEISTSEIMEAIEHADREMADAQRHLLGKIKINDRGEKM